MNDQESCVVNGRITTKYFNFEKGAQQGNHVSAYLFILCLEIIFTFLKDKNSIKELLNTINYFSSFMVLKLNLSKCEVARIGALKGVKVAICGIKCIDLTKEAIKVSGVSVCYDKNLQLESNFRKTILNIERILKM